MDSVTAPENKDYVKFLGVLIDKNLTWKQRSDYNYRYSKINKIISLIAKLRHHVPLKTLLENTNNVNNHTQSYCIINCGNSKLPVDLYGETATSTYHQLLDRVETTSLYRLRVQTMLTTIYKFLHLHI